MEKRFDARQSALASGLQMDDESFPGELAQALELLGEIKDGPMFGIGATREGQFVCWSIAMVV